MNNLGLIFNFSVFEQLINQKEYLITNLSSNFKKIFLINSENINLRTKKKTYNLSSLKKKVPGNIEILNPINYKELFNTLSKKKFILVSNIPMSFEYFFLFRLIKKTNTKLIFINNIGVVGSNVKTNLKIKLQKFFFKKLPMIIIKLLVLVNYFQKIDYRFMSNKILYEKIKYKSNLLFKKNVLINSMQYDEFTAKKYEI